MTNYISPQYLSDVFNNLQSGGVSPDVPEDKPHPQTIPAIRDAIYLTKDEAERELTENDQIVVFYLNKPIVVSIKMFMRHEIVHVLINNNWYSLTYCPLTGTAIAYQDRWLVSGFLYRNNLVMYNWNSLLETRDKDNIITVPQMLGIAINLKDIGYQPPRFPMELTTWSIFKNTFPGEALIVSERSGEKVGINNYSGMSYSVGNIPYISNSMTGVRPLINKREDIPPKNVVKVIQIGNLNIYFAINRYESYLLGRSDTIDIYQNDNKITLTTKIEPSRHDLIIEIEHNMQKIIIDPRRLNDIAWNKKYFGYDAFFFAWYDLYPDSKFVININPPYDIYITQTIVGLLNDDRLVKFFSTGQGFKPPKFLTTFQSNQTIVSMNAPKTQYLKRLILLFLVELTVNINNVWEPFFEPYKSQTGGLNLSWIEINRLINTYLESKNADIFIQKIDNWLAKEPMYF